ncbi:hypothetical protein [Mesorhizobium sp. M1252]|uniref:hypothetical protein n=1 Tax=Mesorhizobium sp. M1252 TaxID=2957073 RepID=UPI0033370420
MTLQGRPTLGILELDEGLLPDSHEQEPRDGALLNPATFATPIITEMVEGALAETVIRGDPSLEIACVAAAARLVERGADVIAGDCGFLIRHQKAVAAAVNVPVIMSSLLLVPTLLRQLGPEKKLAVITADSGYCTEDLLNIDNRADRARVVVAGIEGGVYVANAVARPFVRTAVEQIEKEVGGCIAQLRAKHPEIGALLFECTGFPVVTRALRSTTGLPIYDITDICRLALGTVTGTRSL